VDGGQDRDPWLCQQFLDIQAVGVEGAAQQRDVGRARADQGGGAVPGDNRGLGRREARAVAGREDAAEQAAVCAGFQRHHQPGLVVRRPFRPGHGGIRRGEYPRGLLQQGGTGGGQRDLPRGAFQQAQAQA
jgi:hypothetical protein